ncbi:MAG: phosphoglyceromutase, partial [Spirochaetaceae bacterium]
MNHRLIFIFLDGLGLGENSGHNPFFMQGRKGFFHDLLQDIPSMKTSVETDQLVFCGIDAVCGVDGLPQSATGQTSL